ncbi:transposase [Candidatus Bathyarchaeota archaeon]|nr:transposase [Candidatus Bathyarchaeota archaeon]
MRNIRQRRKSKEINGRLNRWSFRKFQSRVEYKAKLVGLNVVYVKAKGTLSLCPSGYRLMKCSKCGLEEDRDVIAVRKLLQKQIDVLSSTVQGESPSMKRGGKTSVTEVNARSER